MSKVTEYKALLRGVLNAGIVSGASAEETIKGLEIQLGGICTMCTIEHFGYKCYCDKGKVCFIEEAMKTYVKIAKEKCNKNKGE